MAGRSAKQKEKAEKIFTDRVKPRVAFENSLKELTEAPNDIFVLSYYGIGGIGKTKLLNVLIEKVNEINQQNKEKIITVKFDFSVATDQRRVLLNLRNLFVQNGFEFPLWDFAEKQYSKLTGQQSILVDNNVEKVNTTDNPYVDLLVECANAIVPGTTLILKAITATKSIIGDVETARKKLTEVIRKHYNNDEDEFSTVIKKMSKLGAEELLSNFPDYFASDLKNNITATKLPIVIMLDTYEKLVDTYKYLGYGEMQDDWLRENIVDVVPGVLWVIAGRECLHWEKRDSSWNGCIEEHRLGDLVKEDSCEFLKYAKIPTELWEDIYVLTQGTPLFLDLCVDMYYDLKHNTETDITIEILAGENRSKERLLERYVRYMSIEEREILEVEAMLGTWNDEQQELIEKICKKCFGHYNESLYRESLTHSIIYVDEKDNYILHDVVQQAIIQNMESRTKDCIFEELYHYIIEKYGYREYYSYQEITKLLKMVDTCQISEIMVQKVISEIVNCFKRKKRVSIPNTELVRVIYKLRQKMIIPSIDIIELERNLITCLRKDREDCFRYAHMRMNYRSICEELYSLNQKVYEHYLERFGAQDKDTIFFNYNMSEDLYYLGKYDEAINSFERFIDLSKEHCGKNHSITILGYYYLGKSHARNQDYLMAIEKKAMAYELHKNEISDFRYLREGGYEYRLRGYELEESIISDYLELRKCKNSTDIDNNIKEAMKEILVEYAHHIDFRPDEYYDYALSREEYDNAILREMEEVESVIKLLEEIAEADSDCILTVKRILTDKLCDLRRYDEALENEKYIQATCEKKYGRASVKSVACLWQIGDVYERMGNVDIAISYFEVICSDAIIAKIEEEDPFFCISIHSRLLLSYEIHERTEKAANYIEKTKILCDKYRGSISSDREYGIIERAMERIRYITGEPQTTDDDDIFNFEIF